MPKFPPDLRSVFQGLSYEFDSEEMVAISGVIADVLADLRKAADCNDNLDCVLIEELDRVANLFLKIYSESNTDHQRLIAAALRYLVAENDALDDAAFATGLHDDVRVMNHVLEEIGIEDQFISLI